MVLDMGLTSRVRVLGGRFVETCCVLLGIVKSCLENLGGQCVIDGCGVVRI